MGDVANCKLGYFTQWNDAEHSTADNASSVPYYLQCHITRTYPSIISSCKEEILYHILWYQTTSKKKKKKKKRKRKKKEKKKRKESKVAQEDDGNYMIFKKPKYSDSCLYSKYEVIFKLLVLILINGSQLSKMKKSIPDMSLP